MKAITVEPHEPETARFEAIAEPHARGGSVLISSSGKPNRGEQLEVR